MPRLTWRELPASVRAQVQAHTGPITSIGDAGEGFNAEVVAVLHTATDSVFVKGARDDGEDSAWNLRVEAQVAPAVAAIAPALLWQVRADGWHLLGHEYIEASGHTDQRPGSPDLDKMIATLCVLDTITAPPSLEITAAGWWQRYYHNPADVQMLAGQHLVHRDLNPTNFLITGDRAYLVDWGWSVRGPAWLNPAQLVLSLIETGWPIADAEALAARIPSWHTAPAAALDAFAAANARMWDQAVQRDPEWSITYRADIAHQWVNHRRAIADSSVQHTKATSKS